MKSSALLLAIALVLSISVSTWAGIINELEGTIHSLKPNLTAFNSIDLHNLGSLIVSWFDPKEDCICENRKCKCCADLKVVITLANTCLEIIIPEGDVGIEVTADFNNKVIFHRKITVLNPPPYCFDNSEVVDIVNVCLHLYKLALKPENFHGCIKLEASLSDSFTRSIEVGCINIPLQSMTEEIPGIAGLDN